VTNPQTAAYVLMTGERPSAVAPDLETAQASAIADETRYQSEPREHRWDEATVWQTGNGRTWHFMVRSLSTKRWNKTLRSVVQARTIPAALDLAATAPSTVES
jgi:hypothetical protein